MEGLPPAFYRGLLHAIPPSLMAWLAMFMLLRLILA